MEKAKKWDHNINYEESPMLYEFTEDCGGMYTCDPYKTDILRNWKFMNSNSAKDSSAKILTMFDNYLDKGDFVGADMCRKYLQAGSTRRVIKKDCQTIFQQSYNVAINNIQYLKLKLDFLNKKDILLKEDKN